jgi:glycosyltransferase involved in cell wall biosynthesis
VEAGRVEYFKQMCKSVQEQTYKNIEHIIIDGASTDETLDILQEYQKQGYLKYYSEKDNGVYDAVNKGIKKATGDYVVILHSDDYLYDKNVIELQIKYLEKYNADYTIGNTIFIKHNKKTILCGLINFYDRERIFQKGDNIYTFWLEIPYNHEGIVAKKKVYDQIIFDRQEIYGISTDWKFEMELILNDFKYVYVPYNILCFRTNGMSSTFDAKIFHVIKYLYSKFYPINLSNIDEYNVFRYTADELFFSNLKDYLKSLNLKNYDYEKSNYFIDLVYDKNNISALNDINIKLFNIISILKIEKEQNKVKIYILFIPFLEIKKGKKNNTIYYKLFHFIPILKIKK